MKARLLKEENISFESSEELDTITVRAAGCHSLVVDFPCVCSIMRHELQVLYADGLVLQLGHGVIDTLLPGGNVVLLS